MTKNEFILKLQSILSNLPNAEVDERIKFYVEMIDDRIEDGFTEEQAIIDIGPIDNIAEQIVADIPLTKALKEKLKRKKALKGWGITLLILGSPIWFSLLVSVFAVVLSLYVSLWAVVISAWAVFVTMIACFGYGIILGFILIFKNPATGCAYLGLGAISLGLTVFFFNACVKFTKWSARIVKIIIFSHKKKFINKEAC